MRIRRNLRAIDRRVRSARVIARALASPAHPVLAQIVPTRRCNLACAYCHEYDHHSAPVPTPVMLERVDHLARLRTSIVELSGGEPLLHPDVEALIHRIREHQMMAGLLTNGLLLTVDRIRRLNRAGLDHVQISIDNVAPDAISQKSLSALDRRLQWLAEHAMFDVNVNSVLGSGAGRPNDVLAIAKRALELGFTATVGIVHDGAGQLVPLSADQKRMYDEIAALAPPFYSIARHNPYQDNLAAGRPNQWHCPAGGRYLYICEDGLVHWCSQQRGRPALPLDRYGPTDIAREAATEKRCAPYCTVSCVHRVALLDELRVRPAEALAGWLAGRGESGVKPPRSLRLLSWMFVTGPHRDRLRRGAIRLLGARR